MVAALKAALAVAFLVEAGWVSESLGLDQSCSFGVWVLKGMRVSVGGPCWVAVEATWASGTVVRTGACHSHTRGPVVPSARVAKNGQIVGGPRFQLSSSTNVSL